MAWIYGIEVDEAFRGRGYRREAMLLAETEARARDMRSLGLNVHGGNTIARSLYASLGYHVTTQQMKRPCNEHPPRITRSAVGVRGVSLRRATMHTHARSLGGRRCDLGDWLELTRAR